jgi:cell division protease FtsH
MVRDWGLSPRLGPIGFGPEGAAGAGTQPWAARPFAEGTQLAIDEEVTRLLSEAERRATQLLADNRDSLDALIDVLLEKETISGQELTDVVRKVHASPPAGSEQPSDHDGISADKAGSPMPGAS